MEILSLYDAAAGVFEVLPDEANADKAARLREYWPDADEALRALALSLHTAAVERERARAVERRQPPV